MKVQVRLTPIYNCAFTLSAARTVLTTLATSVLTPDVIVSGLGQITAPPPQSFNSVTNESALECPVPDETVTTWFEELSEVERMILAALQWQYRTAFGEPYSKEVVEFVFKFSEPAEKNSVLNAVRQILHDQGVELDNFFHTMEKLMVNICFPS